MDPGTFVVCERASVRTNWKDAEGCSHESTFTACEGSPSCSVNLNFGRRTKELRTHLDRRFFVKGGLQVRETRISSGTISTDNGLLAIIFDAHCIQNMRWDDARTRMSCA